MDYTIVTMVMNEESDSQKIIFEEQLSATQIARVAEYFLKKWGLEITISYKFTSKVPWR